MQPRLYSSSLSHALLWRCANSIRLSPFTRHKTQPIVSNFPRHASPYSTSICEKEEEIEEAIPGGQAPLGERGRQENPRNECTSAQRTNRPRSPERSIPREALKDKHHATKGPASMASSSEDLAFMSTETRVLYRTIAREEEHELWLKAQLGELVSFSLDKGQNNMESPPTTYRERTLLHLAARDLGISSRSVGTEPTCFVKFWKPLSKDGYKRQFECLSYSLMNREVGELATSKRSQKRSRIPGSTALSQWLDIGNRRKRNLYWQEIRSRVEASSLPTVLLQHLNSLHNRKPDEFEFAFEVRTGLYLSTRNLTTHDVLEWARILRGKTPDDKASRFLSSSSDLPTFMLLEVLRLDILQVKNLRLLLIYAWNKLLGKRQSNLSAMSDLEIDAWIPGADLTDPLAESRNCTTLMEENTFQLLLSRLLTQARRIWAPALVSITSMAIPYTMLLLKSNDLSTKLNTRMHNRLSKLINKLLVQLALPSSIDPLKSMNYNWQAQRVILGLAGRFEPALILDQTSYRAVKQVLLASRKTESESRVVQLSTRSWPPWRVEQDGMDAGRSLEDDLSRIILASTRSKESGYNENIQDKAIAILGGQESDGTPTIQTRKLKLQLLKPRKAFTEAAISDKLNPLPWVARIDSTRDVQEAWSAFQSFEDKGGQPSPSMYFAMFEKLNYESARIGRASPGCGVPGDGRELLEPSNDNYSTFYKIRLQPPTLDDLYNRMIQQGIRPAGQCLNFLVKHARTIDMGIRYLHDSDMANQANALFKSVITESPYQSSSGPLSKKTLDSFIYLLCRFAPRVIMVTDDTKDSIEAIIASDGSAYTVFPEKIHMKTSLGLIEPLRFAIKMLSQKQTFFRPTWYTIFQTLALPGLIIDHNLIGSPLSAIKSWEVLVSALSTFHSHGLELDPKGFVILCRCLEKAVLASISLPSSPLPITALPLLKNEFRKISISEKAPYRMPTLLHRLSGLHLHAYIRVLGLSSEHAEILHVLRWMNDNAAELDEVIMQSHNGLSLIRRVFIAVRIFLQGSGYEAEARRLVDNMERWDGWPEEVEMRRYLGMV